jgi:hypothetical protein
MPRKGLEAILRASTRPKEVDDAWRSSPPSPGHVSLGVPGGFFTLGPPYQRSEISRSYGPSPWRTGPRVDRRRRQPPRKETFEETPTLLGGETGPHLLEEEGGDPPRGGSRCGSGSPHRRIRPPPPRAGKKTSLLGAKGGPKPHPPPPTDPKTATSSGCSTCRAPAGSPSRSNHAKTPPP